MRVRRSISFETNVLDEADDQGLYLLPVISGFGDVEKRMTKEAAAEHSWATLLRPLQGRF